MVDCQSSVSAAGADIDLVRPVTVVEFAIGSSIAIPIGSSLSLNCANPASASNHAPESPVQLLSDGAILVSLPPFAVELANNRVDVPSAGEFSAPKTGLKSAAGDL